MSEFHRVEFDPAESAGRTVLQLARDGRAVDQGREGKEGKLAVSWTRLSCHRFRGIEVRLWLSVIAYNLGNLWWRFALPEKIRNWSLTSLQQRLVKTGGRLVKYARYYWPFLAEGRLSRRLFASILRMIAALPLPDG